METVTDKAHLKIRRFSESFRYFLQARRNTPYLICVALSLGTAFSVPIHWRDVSEIGCVKRVGFSAREPDEALVLEATRIANVEYGRICDFLRSSERIARRRFEILFKESIWLRNVGPISGYTSGATIQLSLERIRDVKELGVYLVHEMVHLVQNYKRGAPDFWREGIADFMSFRLGYETPAIRPACDFQYPHYSDGYTCAGAFLCFLADSKEGAVLTLHQALTEGTYSSDFFEKNLGSTLEMLWQRFKESPRFSQSAAEMSVLRAKLQARSNDPMSSVKEFLKTIVGGSETADAIKFVEALARDSDLPGYSGTSLNALVFEHGDLNYSPGYPATRTVRFMKDGRRFTYFLSRLNAESEWIIQKMLCRKNDNGQMEFSRNFESSDSLPSPAEMDKLH
jgi:hypothetical protein